MSMKNCSDNIRNPTRDLPACSAVPQPTAPPRAPLHWRSNSISGRGLLNEPSTPVSITVGELSGCPVCLNPLHRSDYCVYYPVKTIRHAEERRYSSTHSWLDTRWRLMVNVTFQPLYVWSKSPRYSLIWDWVDSGAVWAFWKRKCYLPLSGIELFQSTEGSFSRG